MSEKESIKKSPKPSNVCHQAKFHHEIPALWTWSSTKSFLLYLLIQKIQEMIYPHSPHLHMSQSPHAVCYAGNNADVNGFP